MRYRTVNLRPHTYERLKVYQLRGKSLSDAIDDLMDSVEPATLYAKEMLLAEKALQEIERGGGLPVAEVEKRLPWLKTPPDASVRTRGLPKIPSGPRSGQETGRARPRTKDLGRRQNARVGPVHR